MFNTKLISTCYVGADRPEERHEPRGDDRHDQQSGRPGGHRDEDAGETFNGRRPLVLLIM